MGKTMLTVFDLPLDVMRQVFNNLNSIYDFSAIAQFKQFHEYIVDYFAVLTDIDEDNYRFHGIQLKKINVNNVVRLKSNGEQEHGNRSIGFHGHFDNQNVDISDQIYQILNHKEFFIINIHNGNCSALNVIPQLVKHKKYHTINFINDQPKVAKSHVFFNRPYIKNEYNSDDSNKEKITTIGSLYILLSQIPLYFYNGPQNYLKGPIEAITLSKLTNLKTVIINIKSHGDTFVLENINLPHLTTLDFEVEGPAPQFQTDIYGLYDDRSIYFASNIDPSSSPIGLVHCKFPKLKILNGNFEFIAHCEFDTLKSLTVQYVKCLLLEDVFIPKAEIFKVLRNNAARASDSAYDMSYGEAQNILERWKKYEFPDMGSNFEIIPGMVRRSFNLCRIYNIVADSLIYTIPPEMKKWDLRTQSIAL